MSPPRVHGLLVGIDRYASRPGDELRPFEDLDGAVRDAKKVHAYLTRDFGLPAGDLRLLTASRGLTAEPKEADPDRPGYHQLVAAFREITARGVAGDLFFFYFSGHGARVPALVPEHRAGLDECLVPWDAELAAGRLLHDVELSFLLAELAVRGVDTVVVLDACFAGGALRALPRVRARGARVAKTEREWRAAPSMVAGPAELSAFVARRALAGARDFGEWVGGGPRHTLLAACAAHEIALEAPLEDGRVGGLFTASLLAALRRGGGGQASYRELFHRVRSALLLAGSSQTPQAEGALDRPFLGRELCPSAPGLVVLASREDGGLILDGGALLGLEPGALFRHPSTGTPEAVFEAATVDEGQSIVRLTSGAPKQPIAPGDRLAVLSPLPWRLLRRVCLVGDAAGLPGLADGLDQPPRTQERFVRRALDDECADFRVVLDATGHFTIESALGEPLALGPPLAAEAEGAGRELVRRLGHLARFEAVRALHNRDAASRLGRAVVLEVDGVAVTAPGRLASGQRLALRVINVGEAVLYVTLLSLGADWSIAQLWPPGPWSILEPGRGTPLLAVAAELPAELVRGKAMLKVFVSETPASFHWLELPSLLDPEPPPVRRGPTLSALDEFLAAWSAGTVTASTVVRSSAGDWGTTEWEAELHRSPVRASSD